MRGVSRNTGRCSTQYLIESPSSGSGRDAKLPEVLITAI